MVSLSNPTKDFENLIEYLSSVVCQFYNFFSVARTLFRYRSRSETHLISCAL